MRTLIKAFISETPADPERLMRGGVKTPFSRLAADLFKLQCGSIPEYGAYARYLDTRVHDWPDIPAIPVSAFRSHDLGASIQGRETVTFETSGTTISRPGRVRLEDTSLYEASLLRNFARHLVPDHARFRAVVFGPRKEEAPRSSLWFMAHHVVKELCQGGVWVVEGGNPRWDRADREFKRALDRREPILLFGTTLLFHAYFQRCAREGIRFALPAGSRAMDTGGSKGVSVDLSRENVHENFERILGIPATHVVNEYGMAEMGSQFYEDSYLAFHERRPARPGFAIPPWVRTSVLDPETMRETPPGKPGILVHYDLANLEIPLAIQTEDVGSLAGDRLHLWGRLPRAERRGCSLSFEKFVQREQAR